MVSHSWLYECLVADVFETKLNQITVEVPDEGGVNSTKKNYDLKSNDEFWAKNASLPFPNVAEHIDQELADYKTKAAEITRSAGATSLEDLDGTANASQLKHALEGQSLKQCTFNIQLTFSSTSCTKRAQSTTGYASLHNHHIWNLC
jgi:hypothetical protein